MLNAYDVSVGVFIRGLTNLKGQLAKAEDHAAASGGHEAALLEARLPADRSGPDVAGYAPKDLHMFTLSDHVHWAAEGAKLAMGHLTGVRAVPAANEAKSFAALHERIDTTIAHLRAIVPGDLESGVDRTIVIEHPRGSSQSTGDRFLLAFAIPHFFYHITTAYGILRNQGVQLTMGDFLGNWAS